MTISSTTTTLVGCYLPNRVGVNTALSQPVDDLVASVLGWLWWGHPLCVWLIRWDEGPKSATACRADAVDAFLVLGDKCAVGGLGAGFDKWWGRKAGALVEDLGV